MVIRFLRRLFVAAYLVEAGLILIVAPWTELWRQNFFAAHFPWLRAAMAARSGQTLVVLTGLVTALFGLNDVRHLIFRRPATEVRAADKTPPAA